ncbi:MAG: hypothetical protein IPK72_14420 [Candidatus Eisenbacteria bacterium]|nr:hypothetical protein [Candidatus Eisenbacteria bacterium]
MRTFHVTTGGRLAVLAGLSLWGCAERPTEPTMARSYAKPSQWSLEATIRSYADAFLAIQQPGGEYDLAPRVQTHLKTEISMAWASTALGDPIYAQSGWADHQWVIGNRMEANGGLNWDGPANPYFFEVHQHWFLIANATLARAARPPFDTHDTCARAWSFLAGENAARLDFYETNLRRHGAFFAFRDVDRRGRFQTQAPFKGSYETGAAIWALALHRNSDWAQRATTGGGRAIDYLPRIVAAALRPPAEKGYWDASTAAWIRAHLWNGNGWQGWQGPDAKYGFHLQEAMLEYLYESGATTGWSETAACSRQLIGRVRANGTIQGLPDGYGSPEYEYGVALSLLALTARAARDRDPVLSADAYAAAGAVAARIVAWFPPGTQEDHAMILLGLARYVAIGRALGNVS